MCVSIHNKKGTLGQKDCTIWETREVRERSGVFISYKVHLFIVAPRAAICGNEVVEAGEECDCGWDDECRDACCFPQTSSGPVHHRPCTRTPGAICR